ncbi:MAG: hypothetical protein WAO52_19595 [Prolixibacteraceae bacterium]
MKRNQFLQFGLFLLLITCFSSMSSGSTGFSKPDSIQIVFDDQQLLLPGESFRIGIKSFHRNGKVKSTIGLLGGSAWWWNYKVEVSGGTDYSGRINVSEKLIPSKGKYISIRAFPRKQPALKKELLLPLNYETKIAWHPTNNFEKSPGSQIQGEVISEFDNRMVRVYSNWRDKQETGNFWFSGQGGYWDNGRFTINPDFMLLEKHRAELVVRSQRNTSVADTFGILMDYKRPYNLRFFGSSGFQGSAGNSGSSGAPGYHGSDGQNGQNGEFGDNGPDVGIWVDLYRDSVLNADLLYVYVQNLSSGKENRYLINPEGGSMKISSSGGSGGFGGSGGSGGAGGNGVAGETWIETHMEKQTIKKPITKKVIRKEMKKRKDAEGKEYEVEVEYETTETEYVDVIIDVVVEVVKQGPGGPGGNGGWGGAGGLGGVGGYGGNITLHFTDDARPYQHLFTARSEGGSGGMHGSGGHGGSGGAGGSGNPNGRRGVNGSSGPSAIGWADSGGSGKIFIKPTEEFFYYLPKKSQ